MSYRSESVERRWLERLWNLSTQITDSVKNEFTGESVHVDESATDDQQKSSLSLACFLLSTHIVFPCVPYV